MLRHLPKLTQLVSNRERTRILVGFIYLFSPQTPGRQLLLWFRGSEKLPPDLTGPWSLGLPFPLPVLPLLLSGI